MRTALSVILALAVTLLLFGLGMSGRIRVAIRRRQMSREQMYRDGMICIRCGYNMRTTPERCSECGYRPGGQGDA